MAGDGRIVDDDPVEGVADACPLCGGAVRLYARDSLRAYVRCVVCELVSVPPAWHLDADAERRRYDLHRNSPSDEGYVRFLSRLIEAVVPWLRPASHGLDFGSGPSPVLADLMSRRGFVMTKYDPFYADDRDALGRTYDFVVCCEVVEHFRRPGRDWALLASLVAPGGWLGVMTSKWAGSPREFLRWRYAMDETHLAFYGPPAMSWIAAKHGMAIASEEGAITLFRR